MRVIGITNLILDYYFFNDEIYINGGGSVSNILANLSNMGMKAKIIGYYGNDTAGLAAKTALEKTKVDTSLLEKKDYHTKCFFIDAEGTKSNCPYCSTKRKNYPLCKNIKKYINDDDIILVQDYVFLGDIANKVCLDFGYFNKLIYQDKAAIEKFIFRKYYIVSIKEEALFFILNKLNLTFEQFQEKNNIYFLIITKGKKGATILFNNQRFDYAPVPFEETETNGCGDIFLATFIYEVTKRKKLEPIDIEKIYQLAQQNVFKVIRNIGARNHLVRNQKISKKKNHCICEDFTILS